MALAYRTLFRNCHYPLSITKPVRWNVGNNDTIRVLASSICYQNNHVSRSLQERKNVFFIPNSIRHCTTKQCPSDKVPDQEEKKEGLLQKIKQMYKDYWYVIVPVHMSTSCIWFGSAYYIVRSGLDVISLLQSLGLSEAIINPLRDSSAGYFALALALYKLVTPLRYAVTAGVTTYAIKRLQYMGWIKPVPSRERLKEMYQEKKVNIQDRIQESKQHYQMKYKQSKVMDEMKRYKSEMRAIKDKVKKA